MHPIIMQFMIKERIKDLTAELKLARMRVPAQKEAEPKKKTKGVQICLGLCRFFSSFQKPKAQ